MPLSLIQYLLNILCISKRIRNRNSVLCKIIGHLRYNYKKLFSYALDWLSRIVKRLSISLR